MSKITWIVICFAVPFVVGLGLSLFGVPTTVIAPAVGVIVLIIWVYGVNNRPVTNVFSANRDQMLAQGPPANYGLVYVHRGPSGWRPCGRDRCEVGQRERRAAEGRALHSIGGRTGKSPACGRFEDALSGSSSGLRRRRGLRLASRSVRARQPSSD